VGDWPRQLLGSPKAAKRQASDRLWPVKTPGAKWMVIGGELSPANSGLKRYFRKVYFLGSAAKL
jgi:hypothetical protein